MLATLELAIMAVPRAGMSHGNQTGASNPFSFTSFVGQKLAEPNYGCDLFDEMLNASFRSSARPTSRNSLIVVDDPEDLISSDGMKRPKSLDVITRCKERDNRRLSFQTMLPFEDVKTSTGDGDSEDERFLESPKHAVAVERKGNCNDIYDTSPQYRIRLRELEDENEKLKEQTSSITRANDLTLARLRNLEQQLEDQKREEREETAALEKMVQGVEKNLQRAMERAASAEALSASLKQELKALQASYKQLEHECELLRRENICATATAVASKLRLASDSAEAQLKSLLEGVGHLRLYSDILSSVSRVQEEPS